jgi:voltage-gated sodium channel
MSLATPDQPRRTIREVLRIVVEDKRTQIAIMLIIGLNAITLGLETWPAAVDLAGTALSMTDKAVLAFFVLELSLKFFVYRLSFFRSPWNIFDLAVVLVTLAPSGTGLTVLRSLRIVRALRLVSSVPGMRRVVSGLLNAIPSMGSIILLLGIVFYVCSVISTKLFGEAFPEWFGSIGQSAFSLFQIMTLESWSMGIVRPVMEQFPHAWAVFVTFILVTSFVILNLFIAVVVSAMQREHETEMEKDQEEARSERKQLLDELSTLRQEVQGLTAMLRDRELQPDRKES